MKHVTITSHVKHNFDTFHEGAELSLDDATADTLISSGVAQERVATPHVEPVVAQPKKIVEPTKALSELNRDELEAHAQEIGMQPPFDNTTYPNKASLIDGIKAYKESN